MEHSNNSDNSTSTNTPTYDTTQPLGQRFRHAREKMGISLDESAKRTFILKRHLEALENGQYDLLPQPTFARGFAVNYGKFLGLDNELVTQSFDAQYPTHLKQQYEDVRHTPLQPMGTLQRDARSGIKINPFIIIGILVALGLAFFIFSTVNKAHNDTQNPDTTTNVQDMNSQEQATGADLNNVGSAIPSTVPASGLPATGAVIAGTSVGSAPSSTVAGASTIDLWVQKPTSLTITDASGQTLITGEQSRGARTLSGKPPFNISIDNVSNVSLDLNKQPIKLSDYAQNNKANFTLNP